MLLISPQSLYKPVKTIDLDEPKMAIFFLFHNRNIFCGAHRKRLNETLPMSTHNKCFYEEMKIKCAI